MKASEESEGDQRRLAVKPERAAEMLDCSRSQIYAMIRSGRLKAVRLSPGPKGGIRVLSESIDQFLKAPEGSRPLTSGERASYFKRDRAMARRGW